MKKSWKTTSAGILLIAGAIVTFVFTKKVDLNPTMVMAQVTAVLGGIGFLFAKDSNVTGGDVQQ